MGRHIDPDIQYEEDGKPIVNGSAYFGVANQDPVLNPITIYSDRNVTVPITNPQPTDSQGRLINEVYVAVNQYSYQVNDALGNQQSLQMLLEPLNTVGLVTADIDMNGFKVTNAGDATGNTDYATFGQNNELYGQVVDSAIGSTPDAIIANFPVSPDALLNGQQIRVRLQHGPNVTTTPTLKVNGFSAKTMVRDSDGALFAGDTTGDEGYIDIVYNLNIDNVVLLNPFKSADSVKADSATLAADSTLLNNQLPSYYLDMLGEGLDYTNDSGDVAKDINVSDGRIVDSTRLNMLILPTEMTKRIDASWAAGDDAGGFPTGITLAINTWYRIFIIGKPDGTTDIGFDTVGSAANLLSDATGYTLFRRIGWARTDGAFNIYRFFNDGYRNITWDIPFTDLNTGTPSTVGADFFTISPINTRAKFSSTLKILFAASQTNNLTLTRTDATNRVADGSHGFTQTNADAVQTGISVNTSIDYVRADAIRKIRYRTTGASGDALVILNLGYQDDLEVA